MKNRVTKMLLFLYWASLTISCTTKVPEGSLVDKEQIKKEIQAKEDEFAAVYNTGEMRNIGYYAEDATSYTQNRSPLVGKAAIVEYLKANLDSIDKSRKISFETREVFVTDDGKYVLEIGYYKVVDSTNTAVNTGNYMSLFEKRDGKYYCLRDMSASDMPVE